MWPWPCSLCGRVKGHVTFFFLNFGTLHNFWTEEARHSVFSLLDWPSRVLHNGQWMMNNPKWEWPGSHDLLFNFLDPTLHNFSTNEARDFGASIHSGWWMTPKEAWSGSCDLLFTCVSYAEARNSCRLDVRLSVRHTLAPYQNGWIYCHAFFTTR